MGDAADDLFDKAVVQEAEIEQEVMLWLEKTDDELKKATANSRLPIIVSIRGFRRLSHKQRRVLARYLAENEFGDEG